MNYWRCKHRNTVRDIFCKDALHRYNICYYSLRAEEKYKKIQELIEKLQADEKSKMLKRLIQKILDDNEENA